MNQLAILENLERVAGVMRRGGLHRFTRLGRSFIKTLLKEELSVSFDNLSLSGPMELRGQLYQVRSGRLEPLMSQLFRKAVSPNSVVLDVGACLGYYSLLAAKYGARVYAFEPDPTILPYLMTNITKNSFQDRIVTVSKAVSNAKGLMPFFLHDCAALNSLFDRSGEVKQTVQVELITIDEFLGDSVQVDIVKMDIQGAELYALEGMERMIRFANRPLTMFVECWPQGLNMSGGSATLLVNRLKDLGFTTLIIDEHNRCLAPIDYDIDSVKYVNLYCVRH
jgi:FkbM family methyltransferase